MILKPNASFCGAWALSSQPVSSLLPEADREAMLRQINIPVSGRVDYLDGPLWLAAQRSKASRAGRRFVAFEGMIEEEREAEQIIGELATRGVNGRGDELRLSGEYALAYADAGDRTLMIVSDPSTREPVYYARLGDLLVFSPDARTVLAVSRLPRRFDPAATAEAVLAGAVVLGNATLFEGVQKILGGHLLVARHGQLRHLWHWGDPLALEAGGLRVPETGDLGERAARYRDGLRRLVRRAVRGDRKVAVSLSGGIDSSVMAATAAEVVGPENVLAFTYEYDHPGYPPDARFAALACRALGIRHQIFSFSAKEVVAATPRLYWALEPTMRGGPLPWLLSAERLRELGFDWFFTGDSIGDMGRNIDYIGRLARWVTGLPLRDWALRYWKWGSWSSPHWRWGLWPSRYERWVKMPMAPSRRHLYFAVLCVLKHRGLLRNLEPFFPRSLAPLVRVAAHPERLRAGLDWLRDLSLEEALIRLYFSHRVHSGVMTSPRTFMRATGAMPVSPGDSPELLRLSMIPPSERLGPWDFRHFLKPRGKPLLQAAFRGVLPDENLFRPKSKGWPPPAGWQGPLHGLVDSVPLPPWDWAAQLDWDRLVPERLRLRLLSLLYHGDLDFQPPTWEDLAKRAFRSCDGPALGRQVSS